jgi:hypothetical protein
VAVGAITRKVFLLILTDSFVIRGYINAPLNMRLSDAINKFLKDTQFLAVTDAEITVIANGTLLEKREFLLVNKNLVTGISPNE